MLWRIRFDAERAGDEFAGIGFAGFCPSAIAARTSKVRARPSQSRIRLSEG